MGIGVETIGNFDVRPLGNGKYSVVTNLPGHVGACIMDEEGVKKLREKYNRQTDTFEKTQKTDKNWVDRYMEGYNKRVQQSIVDPLGFIEQNNLPNTLKGTFDYLDKQG